jgi:hypothetical protein
MSYTATVVLIANIVSIPIMGVLFWLMKKENWLKWLLIIPAVILTDIDHFIFTNVPGFGAEPVQGQRILHFAHTIEFIAVEIILLLVFFLVIDRRGDRNMREWLFSPESRDYSKRWQYYGAWAVRIITMGVMIHWIMDLAIYTYYQKWDYLYISIIEYFLNPT